MISIIIAIGVFRYYQTLAVRYGKIHWKYGLLGMGVCLAVQFLFWLMYGMAGLILDLNHFSQEMEFWSFSIVSILSCIVSLIVVWRLRIFLKKKWKKEAAIRKESEIENIGKNN